MDSFEILILQNTPPPKIGWNPSFLPNRELWIPPKYWSSNQMWNYWILRTRVDNSICPWCRDFLVQENLPNVLENSINCSSKKGKKGVFACITSNEKLLVAGCHQCNLKESIQLLLLRVNNDWSEIREAIKLDIVYLCVPIFFLVCWGISLEKFKPFTLVYPPWH